MQRNRQSYRKKVNQRKLPNFLGQHLMHNKRLLKEMVDSAKIGKQDIVLELGAGKGDLTEILTQRAKKVIAVELDHKFVKTLEKKMTNSPNVTIIHQDILKIYLPKEKFMVVSNIPYAITTPILKKLLNNPLSNFQRGVIVMEKGAAKRFTSKNVKDPNVIAWRMWFDIRIVKGISRKNFSPPPKVDSAMVFINRKKAPTVPTTDYIIFWGLVDYAFKEPRVPIDVALRGIFTSRQMKQLKRTLKMNNENPVSMLTEEQWGIIFDTMIKYVPKFRWPKINRKKLKY